MTWLNNIQNLRLRLRLKIKTKMEIDTEKIKMAVLAVACLYMAGLNLWILFKDWFNEWYRKKKDRKVARRNSVELDERGIPSFVGKSKTDTKLLASLKNKQQQIEENKPIQGILLEPTIGRKEPEPATKSTNDLLVSSEEEIILCSGYDKSDAELAGNQSFMIDEFELMAKSLQGKPITKGEEHQVAEIIIRAQGTDLYEQMVNQIDGAKQRALIVLKGSEAEESISGGSKNGGFDLSRYV